MASRQRASLILGLLLLVTLALGIQADHSTVSDDHEAETAEQHQREAVDKLNRSKQEEVRVSEVAESGAKPAGQTEPTGAELHEPLTLHADAHPPATHDDDDDDETEPSMSEPNTTTDQEDRSAVEAATLADTSDKDLTEATASERAEAAVEPEAADTVDASFPEKAAQSESTKQGFRDMSTLVLDTIESFGTLSTEKQLWWIGLVALQLYNTCPWMITTALILLAGGTFQNEILSLVQESCARLDRPAWCTTDICLLATLGVLVGAVVLAILKFLNSLKQLLCIFCCWRVAAAASRLTLKMAGATISHKFGLLLIDQSTMEMLHQPSEDRAPMLSYVVAGSVALGLRGWLLKILPSSSTLKPLSYISSSLLTIISVQHLFHKISNRTVNGLEAGVLTILWLGCDVLQGIAYNLLGERHKNPARAAAPVSTVHQTSAVPFTVMLFSAGCSICPWSTLQLLIRLSWLSHEWITETMLKILPTAQFEHVQSLLDPVTSHDLEQAAILLGVVSCTAVLQQCWASPHFSLTPRVAFCSLMTAALFRPTLSVMLPENITPTHWVADLCWIILLLLPVKSSSSQRSSYERQVEWADQVRHMSAGTRQQKLRSPLGGLDPKLLREAGWQLPNDTSPAKPEQPIVSEHQEKKVIPPRYHEDRGSFQSPVLGTHREEPHGFSRRSPPVVRTEPQPQQEATQLVEPLVLGSHNPATVIRSHGVNALKHDLGVGEKADSPAKKLRGAQGVGSEARKRKASQD